jgi:hypothetical protein
MITREMHTAQVVDCYTAYYIAQYTDLYEADRGIAQYIDQITITTI